MPLQTPPSRRAALRPAQVVVLSFLGAIGVGTLLLSLPAAHAPGSAVGFLDALFTATSAVCVTGLAVVDTGSAYSRFGQAVILLLIKAGGLGILSLGVLLALVTGRRLGFGERLRLQAQANALQVGGIVRFLRSVLLFTVAAELAGTLLLALRFVPLLGWGEGLFYSLFHSVSAFNNAGFGLYADSLMRFVGDPLVTLVIAALLVLGGLGVVVVFEAALYFRSRGRSRLSLHSKLALSTTALLIGGATLLLLGLEWRNPATLGALPLPERLLAGFFQAVTPRTAGFNTLDYAAMSTPSLLFTLLLMYVGGSPGSTAGGIKTVTFAVLLGSVWTLSRNRGELTVFGRRVELPTVVKAAVIATMGVLFIGGALTLLAVTDPELPVMALIFEVVSAYATVGLSLGVTPELSAAGRLIVVALMFMGRVGLLTFALALAERAPERAVKHPAEDVVIG
jgi:trk system potassium uptake protein